MYKFLKIAILSNLSVRTVFFLIFVLILQNSCAGRNKIDTKISSADNVFVEKTIILKEVKNIEIPLPPNPYEDEETTCQCECPQMPCKNNITSGEFRSFVLSLKGESIARLDAATEAILSAGYEIMKYPDWKQIVKDSMEIFGNPTIVLVQLESEKWKKVKFEEIPQMDLKVTETILIRKSVEEKIQSLLTSVFVSRGVPVNEANKIAEKIVNEYTKRIFFKEK